ncbi:MAG: amino acid racemase [Burkholderiales bacterium]
MKKVLGVLGGMGPLATVDFLRKLIEETPAARDEDHIPVITYCVPQIPERVPAITGHGESPLPAMLAGIHTLKAAGAVAIAIPCNTAHFWYDDMVSQSGLPIIHIADAALAQLEARRVVGKTIGLIATKGTLAAGFFQQRLAARGLQPIVNSDADINQLVLPAIVHVKRNELDAAASLLERAVAQLMAAGAAGVILACTETPVVLDRLSPALRARCVDATRALAKACVEWWGKNANG